MAKYEGGLHEVQMLPQHRGVQTALMLIGLFPFFLYTLLMAAIGSLSGIDHPVACACLWQFR